MGLLKDVHPFIAEVLEGKHDAILPHLERAAKIRMAQAAAKSGLRKNARVRVTEAAGDRAPELVGREGKVERVNPKSVSVELDKAHDNDFKTGWRLPHEWLEVV